MKDVRLILCLVFMFFATGYAQIEINGVWWATSNVAMPGTFSINPENAGMFYQWGSNVGWSSSDPLTATDGINTWRDLSETGDIWLPEKNPCPAGWRVPTGGELESLASANNYWGNLNGVNGRFFGSAEPRLFLPATGGRFDNGALWYIGEYAFYMSSVVGLLNNENVFIIWIFNSSPIGSFLSSRKAANPIRCVSEQCDFDVAFYANDVHYENLSDTTFCASYVNFRAEMEFSPIDLEWYVNGNEEVSARGELEWGRNLPNGNHEIEMRAHFENCATKIVTSTLNVQALWIKIRNIRH